MNHVANNFASRIRLGQPHSEHALKALEGLANISDRLAGEGRKLEGNRDLTSTGRANQLANLVTRDLVKEFARASQPGRKALAHQVIQKAALGLPKVEKGDVVEMMLRMEIRSHVASLPLHERLLAMQNPELRLAVFDAPAALSGIPQKEFDDGKKSLLRELHGPRLVEIDGVVSDYANVAAYAGMVRDELAQHSGLSRDAFESMVRTLEEQADGGNPSPGAPALVAVA